MGGATAPIVLSEHVGCFRPGSVIACSGHTHVLITLALLRTASTSTVWPASRCCRLWAVPGAEQYTELHSWYQALPGVPGPTAPAQPAASCSVGSRQRGAAPNLGGAVAGTGAPLFLASRCAAACPAISSCLAALMAACQRGSPFLLKLPVWSAAQGTWSSDHTQFLA